MQAVSQHLRDWMAQQTHPCPPAGETPLRAELFGLEQLVRHAAGLAAQHRVVTRRGSHGLLARLHQNEQILREYNRATYATDHTRQVTHAAEWLLDNFYLVEEQIQLARRHLPLGYSRELPRLLNGPSAALPRVYDLVLELISHVDAQIDGEPLRAFVASYQTVATLKMGELWAVPIMLRLALIENLRRVTTRLTLGRHDRDLADTWVDRLQAMAEERPAHLVVVLADMAKADLPLTSAFVAEFCRRLACQSPVVQLARTWLEERLAEQGLSIDQLVRLESQNQSADQVSVSHTITSLRFLGANDWRVFVEDLSAVEQTLRTDPSAVYATMDFATRDRYRHAVEALARHSRFGEADIARHAIQLAEKGAREKGRSDRSAHVGYYLVDDGQTALEQALGVRWPWRTRLERALLRRPLVVYGGGIGALTALLTFLLSYQALALGVRGWPLALFTLVFLLCSSQLAVAVLNWLSTLLVKPRLLPRLDCSTGIASDCRTMVAVPTLLTCASGIDQLLETIEIHYLANRDLNLYFALLTDFRDAAQESLPTDDALLRRVQDGIVALNRRYRTDRPCIFFLFHRPRRWNAVEHLWMAYERKRGKLTEFNALLRGGARERFSATVGELSLLPGIRFVITLDTDTQLPRDAARRLVGTIAHPLNRPRFDPVRGIVTKGYSILQPRVGVSLPSAGRSWFVQLFAGDVGIDPYTRAVSDVYQDLFQEGSFIGKGIYDVDAFQLAVAGRFPENAVLSHDLIESCHARSALVSDIEFYEEYPARYNTDINRRHRWIRGDWQIAQWLLPRVPGPDARRIANPLSGLSQWKIFDNLRRSLVPAALMVLLLGNWMLLPQLGSIGPFLLLAIIALPSALASSVALLRKPTDVPLLMHLRSQARSGGRQLGQAFVTFVFLPYDAFISLDAIGRTLLRLCFTHERLLEWQTAGDSERAACANLAGFYRTMLIAPVVAVASGVFLAVGQSSQLPLATPILGLWLLAPWIAWRISQPIVPPVPVLDRHQLAFLRRTARRTWYFFETFVTEQENWLPPDNFQEEPGPVVASRTSPTNLGLAALANLAACDFGYLPVGQLLTRTGNAFASMNRLERFRGHFYNWYDIRTLKPLQPLYISSVDSGNLAGHLLTLGAGLGELPRQPILTPQLFPGLRDTLAVLREITGRNPGLDGLQSELATTPPALATAFAALRRVADEATQVAAGFEDDPAGEARIWSQLLVRAARDHLADLVHLAPWLTLPHPFRRQTPRPPPASGFADETATPPVLEVGLEERLDRLDRAPTLLEIAALEGSLGPLLDTACRGITGDSTTELAERTRLQAWRRCVREGSEHARQRLAVLEELVRQSSDLATMDFVFLFDRARDLFSIGYNVTERRLDPSFYDLLASEARLCSFVAIAQGQISQDHWFSLGRLLVASRGVPVLASWGGSLFEYLMPLLVMPTYDHTLLDQSYRGAVAEQIAYGRLHGIPWGISESQYHRTDVQLNYQYRAFGVPGMGLKRGLGEDLVIAPYAALMGLMVAPREACANLERLVREGRAGAYGYYEAVDYTPSRLPPGQTSITIRSFMAHHQGMGLLALAYRVFDRPMQRRFLSCPMFRAAELLLQEQIPRTAAKVLSTDLELGESRKLAGEGDSAMRISTDPSSHAPEVHLLSNGRYHVMISSAGGGYSRWHDLAVTRWREDATLDGWGSFIYLRDADTGEYWSAAFQPALHALKGYEVVFTQARAEFRQRHAGLEIHSEVSVSPEDDVELRRVTLTNHSHTQRRIELTSYAEVVLAPPADDAAHPAFGNLFVQTEFVPQHPALLCSRRPRSAGERPPWLLHVMVSHGAAEGELSWETDRARFIGRGRTLAHPAALTVVAPLSNTAGAVLDPIVALRRTLTLAPHQTARIDFVLGMAEQRDTALALVEKYQNSRMADRAFDLAWTHSQVTLRHLNASEAEAQLYARLAGALLYANPARRAATAVLLGNRRGQSGLWSHGISGDLPIVLVRISTTAGIELVRQLLQAHSYWRMKGLTVELVILNEDDSVYRQPLHETITRLIASGIAAPLVDKPGGIFARRLEKVSPEDRLLLQSVARVVLFDENGTLAEQLERQRLPEPIVPALVPTRARLLESTDPAVAPPAGLQFDNGLGGFSSDGREYVVTLRADQMTPAPWVNVIANPYFGTVVSETGGAYTWVENCHEFRLTPWSNDPVSDTSGEAFFLRDEQTGQVWSPTPLPARGTTPYVIRHGFGYSVFEHTEFGIATELTVHVAKDAPVKFATLKLRNISGRPRRLSVTGYWEWVLADLRHKSLLHLQTELDPHSGALLVRNTYNTEFAERIAFVDVNDPARSFTGDRMEFLGRNGSLSRPAALRRARLSGKVGAGLDSCGAVQVPCELPPGQEREICFRLGVGRSAAEVQTLVQRFRRTDAVRNSLDEVRQYWRRTLGAVQVETPEPSLDTLANGWLLYQTLSCRVWGRTGFYQSGGAYGFRDQLQDSMALVHAEPTLVREHLLRAAGRQFREGDVQHWWHPPAGRGVRTHCSDDYLWLPYVTCHYLDSTGDTGVLDESIAYLEARLLKPEEESGYDLPNRSAETATLYQHCVRAIEHGQTLGAHGLPLIGGGDWNDGMNRVGHGGQGESVWLAFFLHDVMTRFSRVARARLDFPFADHCLAQADQLRQKVEEHGWDGEWYRRAYFDSGEPLGSRTNPECRIDSLPQSWSVISRAGTPDHARRAMQAVDEHLVRRDSGLVQLLDPPFDRSPLNPGYIRGYIPGVRENGGQYTHAAIWSAMAFALLGETEKAWEIVGLLNPIHHGASPAAIAVYKVEPYVVAADVYAVAPHAGRGGWTWYTGSAGWMYRLLVETLLGVNLEGNRLRVTPRVPRTWTTWGIRYRFGQSQYHLAFKQSSTGVPVPGPVRLTLDGRLLEGDTIPLLDDRRDHAVVIELRCAPHPAPSPAPATPPSPGPAPELLSR